MTNQKDFFVNQLQVTAETIDWAMGLVPENRLLEIPPHRDHPNAEPWVEKFFGAWSAYRQLFHLVYYEKGYALRTMKHWIGEPHPSVDIISPDMEIEEKYWKKQTKDGTNLLALLMQFHSVRKSQVEIVNTLENSLWNVEKVNTMFGKVSFVFVVTKTIEHTLVHGNRILRNALYWDRMLEWLDTENT